jgi:hypothetical protein
MESRIASGGSGGGFPSSITQDKTVICIINASKEMMLTRIPSTLVSRLFLTPNHFLNVTVSLERFTILVMWKRV